MFKPELYTKINSLQRRDAEAFSEEFSEKIGKMSGRCIDIGSGPCDVTVDFILPKLKPDSTLVCSDISEVMVKYGKERYGDNERLSIVKLDIENRDLPKNLLGQFDHATSLYCIHWCLDLSQAVKNIYRLLRPGGTAFLTFAARNPGLDAFGVLQAMPKYRMYITGVRRIIPPFQKVDHPRRIVMDLLADAGFQVRSCSYRGMSHVFETTDQLREYLLAVSPFDTECIPPHLQDDYMRDLMQEFVKREIVFNKNDDDKDEFSLLLRYRVFVIYLKKPLA